VMLLGANAGSYAYLSFVFQDANGNGLLWGNASNSIVMGTDFGAARDPVIVPATAAPSGAAVGMVRLVYHGVDTATATIGVRRFKAEAGAVTTAYSTDAADVRTEARIATEETTRSSADSALSGRVDNVVTSVGNAQTAINNEVTARTTLTDSLASSVSTLNTNFSKLDANPNLLDPLNDWTGSATYRISSSWGPIIEFDGTFADVESTFATSPRVGLAPNVTYTLSCDLLAIGNSTVYANMDVICFDAAGNTLLDGPNTNSIYQADFSDTRPVGAIAVTFTTPANTNYAVVRLLGNARNVASNIGARRIKLERGASATAFTDDSALTATNAALKNEATARATGDSSLASRATTLEARTGGGGNLLINSEFNYPDASSGVAWATWIPYNSSGGYYGPTVGNYGVNGPTSASPQPQINTLWVTNNDASGDFGWYNNVEPQVVAGRYYEASAYLCSVNAYGQISLEWYDANHGRIGDTPIIPFQPIGNNSTYLGGYKQLAVRGQAPANVMYGRVVIRGQTQPPYPTPRILFFCRPMLAEVFSLTGDPLPYQPGSVGAIKSVTARMTTEETVRSTADSALATRATNLEAQINNTSASPLQARIAAEESARVSGDNAIASRTNVLEARAGNDGSYTNANATFSAWPDGAAIPSQWSYWSQNGLMSRNAPGFQPGAYSYRNHAYQDQNSGLCQSIYMTQGYWVLEASAWCSQGNFQGAGVYIDGYDKLNFGRDADLQGTVGAGATGIRQWSIMFYKNEPNQVNIYMMGNWDGFGARSDKTLDWLKCGVRPASDAEVQAGKATTNITSLTSRVATEETVRANADSALATRTSTLEASSAAGDSSTNANPRFSMWPDGQELPNNYYWWNKNGSITRVANSAMEGGYAAQVAASGTADHGHYQQAVPMSGWAVVEADVELTVGNWLGSGFTLSGIYNMDFAREADNTGLVSTSPNTRRRFSKLINIDPGYTSLNLHPMTQWSGFAGSTGIKTIRWHRISARPATDAEIQAGKATVNVAALTSRVSTVETAYVQGDQALATRASNLETRAGNLESSVSTQAGAISTLNGKASAYWQTTAVAGNGRAQMTIHADANGGGGVDIVGDVGISGNLLVGGSVTSGKVAPSAVSQTYFQTLNYNVTINYG